MALRIPLTTAALVACAAEAAMAEQFLCKRLGEFGAVIVDTSTDKLHWIGTFAPVHIGTLRRDPNDHRSVDGSVVFEPFGRSGRYKALVVKTDDGPLLSVQHLFGPDEQDLDPFFCQPADMVNETEAEGASP